MGRLISGRVEPYLPDKLDHILFSTFSCTLFSECVCVHLQFFFVFGLCHRNYFVQYDMMKLGSLPFDLEY